MNPASATDRSWNARLFAGVRQFGRELVDLAFPPACAFCSAELPSDPLQHENQTVDLCLPCRTKLAVGPGPTCSRCGMRTPALLAAAAECPQCAGVRFHFDQVVSLGLYQSELRAAVLRAKHEGQYPLTAALARLLYATCQGRLAALEIDVVCPVPMHWRRRFVRGANAPQAMADILSRSIGLGPAEDLLVRRRNTPLQSELPPRERFRNVRGAFDLRRGYDIRGARVLLVDDVVTTGATASEAARVLRGAGVAFVAVAAVARAEGQN